MVLCSRHGTADFEYEARQLAPNLNLLVLHQEQVVTLLLTALDEPHSLAVEPLLDLLVQLAKDLREDFYRHFSRVCRSLIALLQPADRHPVASATIGQAFNAFVYCFKYLRQYLVTEIDDFFE